MIDASLTEKGMIEVLARTPIEARCVAEINCASKVRNSQGMYFLPCRVNSVVELQRLNARFTPDLAAVAKRLVTIDKYVAHVKEQERVEPLQPVPIKAPYALYQHQVKAYNIALALFGRGAKKGGAQ